jgi:hypothetical protein
MSNLVESRNEARLRAAAPPPIIAIVCFIVPKLF